MEGSREILKSEERGEERDVRVVEGETRWRDEVWRDGECVC